MIHRFVPVFPLIFMGVMFDVLIIPARAAYCQVMRPDTIIITDRTAASCVDSTFRRIIDTSAARTAGDFAALSEQRWNSFPPLPLNGGYTNAAVWASAVVMDLSDVNQYWILTLDYALLDEIEMYIQDRSGIRLYGKCGRITGKKWPTLPDSRPAFILPKIKKTPFRLFLRIKTSDVCAVSIRIQDLWSFSKASASTKMLFGLYFGCLALIALLNGALYFWARFSSCLWYTLYVISFALFQVFSCGLWDNSNKPIWLMLTAVPFFAGASILCGSGFTIDFLSLRKNKNLPSLIPFLFITFACIGIVIMLASVAQQGRFAAIATSLVAPCFVVICPVTGLLLIKTFGRMAIFFTVAASALALGTVLNALRNFGVFPDNLLTVHGTLFGSIIEFVLLAAALVDRIASIEQEKMDAREKAQVADRLASESRFRALQAQINPHFLFNTLNMLSEYIAIMPSKAEKLVIELSKFFRYTLIASKRRIVPLSEELEIVRTYLSIEKERFGKRLEFDMRVEGDPSRIGVLGLLIQPIVENSIKYGVSPLPEGARIDILCAVSEQWVSIRIKDSGRGFGSVSLNGGGTGVGISSVKERLSLMFGENGTITCSNDNGALVEIIFPRREYHDIQSNHSR